MTLLSSLFRSDKSQERLRPLYDAIVAQARAPHWYLAGGVPDTVDGRFDMVAAILSLVLLRLETLEAVEDTARLAEIFVTDMDGQLRQIGIGDLVVGKHIGRMMSALGGRIGAYRAGLALSAPLEDAVVRNIYRGVTPAPEALAHVTQALRAVAAGLDERTLDDLHAGRLEPVR